jgi:hypothetical protein
LIFTDFLKGFGKRWKNQAEEMGKRFYLEDEMWCDAQGMKKKIVV